MGVHGGEGDGGVVFGKALPEVVEEEEAGGAAQQEEAGEEVAALRVTLVDVPCGERQRR